MSKSGPKSRKKLQLKSSSNPKISSFFTKLPAQTKIATSINKEINKTVPAKNQAQTSKDVLLVVSSDDKDVISQTPMPVKPKKVTSKTSEEHQPILGQITNLPDSPNLRKRKLSSESRTSCGKENSGDLFPSDPCNVFSSDLNDIVSNDKFSNDKFSNDIFSNDIYSNDMLSNNDPSTDQLSTSKSKRHRKTSGGNADEPISFQLAAKSAFVAPGKIKVVSPSVLFAKQAPDTKGSSSNSIVISKTVLSSPQDFFELCPDTTELDVFGNDGERKRSPEISVTCKRPERQRGEVRDDIIEGRTEDDIIEVTPEKIKGVTSVKNIEVTSVKNKEITSVKNKEGTPVKNKEVTPVKNKDMSKRKKHDTSGSPSPKGTPGKNGLKTPMKSLVNSAKKNSMETTPVKTPTKSPVKTPTKIPMKTPTKSPTRTPTRIRRTPVKLFDKSPKVRDFNVQILENFIRITPSKSNKRVSREGTPVKSRGGTPIKSKDDTPIKTKAGTPNKSGSKKQKSILDYASSSISKSLEVQSQNEFTPVKPASPKKETPKSSRFKMKLNFSGQGNETNTSTRNALEFTKGKHNVESQKEVEPELITAVEKNTSFDASEFDGMFDETFMESLDCNSFNFNLDLTESQHCTVINVDRFVNKASIVVESTKTKEKALCNLEGFWMHLNLERGATVHLQASKLTPTSQEWLVSNDVGLLVYEPDALISSTSVVGSVFCKRRSVLSERFQGFEPCNRQMVVGTLVHTLLQTVLREKSRSLPEITRHLDGVLKGKDTIHRLYASSLTLEDLRKELMEFVPRVQTFVETYVKNNSREMRVAGKKTMNKLDWKGQIDSILDIEENIWCPELGIKGKVDVSVKSGLVTMPLELKTGRATMSLEHRGQVILYIMMMKKFGYAVDSGLLLYLREGVLRDVTMNRGEKRDLMILRNELAYYLTKQPRVINKEMEREDLGLKERQNLVLKEKQNLGLKEKQNLSIKEKQTPEIKQTQQTILQPPELPEPINHHSACEKCPYSTICTTYLNAESHDISSNTILKKVKAAAHLYLKESHVQYFLKWSAMIQLEHCQSGLGKNLKEIYTVAPEERERKGKCITNVAIVKCEEDDGMYVQTFRKKHTAIASSRSTNSTSTNSTSTNFLASGILEGSYVVVSTDKRPAVATGFITDMQTDSITVTLERDLGAKFKDSLFHLDTYDSSSTVSFNLTSLGLLLEPTEKCAQLRRLIIDKESPTYQLKLQKSIVTKCAPILKNLNKLQQRAIVKALTTNEYLLIKGMPGTGKTATIVALVELLVLLNQSVLITSHTHSAVDNVCLRLKKKGIEVMRLGSEGRIHRELKDRSERALTKDCVNTEQLEEVYNGVKVLAVTCLGSGHPILSKRTLDVCIIDESTQVLQSSLIRVLSATKKFILIGDPDQLPPVVRNEEAVEQGLSESLFERLCNKENTVTLTHNYRMNKTITNLANKLTYKDALLVANDAVGRATLTIPRLNALPAPYKTQPWISKILNTSLEKSVQVIDTGNVHALRDSFSIPWLDKIKSFDAQGDEYQSHYITNPFEISVIATLVDALIKCGVPPDSIGVMAPYRRQVADLAFVLQQFNVEVNTVDQFQGRDKEIVLYSCTKSNSCHESSVGKNFGGRNFDGKNFDGKNFENKCEGGNIENKCDGKDIENKCKGKDIENKCEGKDIENKCDGKDIENKCEGKNIENKCDGKDIENKCEGKDIENECNKFESIKSEKFQNKKYHILNDKRRLTVAITRAKHKLVMVGDVRTIKMFEPFSQLFSFIKDENYLRVQDKEVEFDWRSVLALSEISF